MKLKLIFFLFFSLLFATISARAQSTGTTGDITILNIVTSAMSTGASGLLTKAISWLGSFMLVQFLMTNLGLLKSGADLEAVIGKVIASLMWFGFCYYVMNYGPAFISSVGTSVFQSFAPNLPSPGTVMLSVTAVSGVLAGIGAAVNYANSTVGMLFLYLALIIFFVGMYFACKVFLLQLELGLIVMIAPLSFSFLGMNALRDQGIAPFKSLISLCYRIILFGIIFQAFGQIGDVVSNILTGMTTAKIVTSIGSAATFTKTIMAAFASYILLAYLVFKSDSIAASLAGGSSSMGTGDMAAAVAMGAAAGAAAATGASMIGGATKGGEPMSNFMKELAGGGGNGSVSNASPTGTGPAPVGDAPQPRQSMSTNASYPTNSVGAPMRDSQVASSSGSSGAQSSAGGVSSGTEKTQDVESMSADSGNSSDSTDQTISDSGPHAGIGAPNSSPNGNPTDQKLDKLLDALGQKKEPSFGDRMGQLNQHIGQEKAATQVSINANHHD